MLKWKQRYKMQVAFVWEKIEQKLSTFFNWTRTDTESKVLLLCNLWFLCWQILCNSFQRGKPKLFFSILPKNNFVYPPLVEKFSCFRLFSWKTLWLVVCKNKINEQTLILIKGCALGLVTDEDTKVKPTTSTMLHSSFQRFSNILETCERLARKIWVQSALRCARFAFALRQSCGSRNSTQNEHHYFNPRNSWRAQNIKRAKRNIFFFFFFFPLLSKSPYT